MEISYSADVNDLDRPAYDAQAERPDLPIRLRVQPTLLRVKPGKVGGNHKAWAGVSWTLECKDAEEAIAIRDALKSFFLALSRVGPAIVQQGLTQLSQVK
jgi:hypothetical protein